VNQWNISVQREVVKDLVVDLDPFFEKYQAIGLTAHNGVDFSWIPDGELVCFPTDGKGKVGLFQADREISQNQRHHKRCAFK
jgi:Tol biopolymer transport system component